MQYKVLILYQIFDKIPVLKDEFIQIDRISTDFTDQLFFIMIHST